MGVAEFKNIKIGDPVFFKEMAKNGFVFIKFISDSVNQYILSCLNGKPNCIIITKQFYIN